MVEKKLFNLYFTRNILCDKGATFDTLYTYLFREKFLEYLLNWSTQSKEKAQKTWMRLNNTTKQRPFCFLDHLFFFLIRLRKPKLSYTEITYFSHM